MLGDRWTILVMREAFMRVRRFDDFQRNLGVARNVLTDRLGRLVDEGILERVPYQDRPARFEYRLTEKGLDLWPVDDGPAAVGRSPLPGRGRAARASSAIATAAARSRGHLTCAKCGAELGPRDVVAEPGPGVLAAA